MATSDKPDNTISMQNRLFSAVDFETFVKENAKLLVGTPQLCHYLSSLCRDINESPAVIIQRAGIERSYGYQLFNGTRKPSRDKLIQLSFGFRMDVDSAQELLKNARQTTLYPKIMRDAAIMRCLHDGKTIDETQMLLSSMGLTLLGGEDKNG